MTVDYNDNSLTSMQRMLSTCSGTLLTSFFVTPFDVVKTRLQATTGSKKCLAYCNCVAEDLCLAIYGNHKPSTDYFLQPKVKFNSTTKVMWKIVRLEGLKSLWSGLTPTLVMSAPATMIYYPTYELIRDKLYERSDNVMVPAVSGAISRSIAVTLVSPIDLIRTKMQSKPLSTTELTNSIKTSVRYEGIKSMYIGWLPTMLRDVPFSMVYWYLYENCKQNIHFQSLFIKSFVSGVSSGAISAILTQPFDVIKTKRQIMLGEKFLFGKSAKHTSLPHIVKEIARNNGLSGFFVGLTPRCLKVAPACAIMITSYELSKRFFVNYGQQK